MSSLSDVARLNVLIELLSECASTVELEPLLRVATGRLRWVIEFERCAFAIQRPGGGIQYWVKVQTDALTEASLGALSQEEAALIHDVSASGTPAFGPGALCVPLEAAGRTVGALCLSGQATNYTYRDLRLGHHAGLYLGTLLSRMDLEGETQRLNRRKDELLAVLSHELRNPLAPITTAVQLLKRSANGQPTPELDIIERQAQQLVTLVDDLLDVTRLTRGKLTLKRAPIELATIAARAVEMVTALYERRHHTLAIHIPVTGLGINADDHRLTQVIANLLSNAAHYTPEGGHVRLAAHRDDGDVVVEVADDGIGISKEGLSDIFELFVQGTSRPSGQGGLGLGLVVVKQLTELHGGSVTAASDGNGQGSTFTLRLPFSAVLPRAEVAVLAPGSEFPGRVLVVDDNRDAADLLATFLERAGHTVAVAYDGHTALAIFDQFGPSIAVIDIGMPGMDGYELVTRLRAREREATFHLIALSGYSQPKDRERSATVGFGDHLVKPVELDQLSRLISSTARRLAHGECPGPPRAAVLASPP